MTCLLKRRTFRQIRLFWHLCQIFRRTVKLMKWPKTKCRCCLANETSSSRSFTCLRWIYIVLDQQSYIQGDSKVRKILNRISQQQQNNGNVIFATCRFNTRSLTQGSVSSLRKCQIRILRMFLPLEGSFRGKNFENFFTWVIHIRSIFKSLKLKNLIATSCCLWSK